MNMKFYESKKGRPVGSFTVLDRTIKKCSVCNSIKPIQEFYGDKTRTDKKSAYCKPCKLAANRNYKLRSAECSETNTVL